MNKNFIYIGNISEIKDRTARVSVNEHTTDFLHILSTATADKQSWTPVKINEQVVILAPYGELNNGVILRGLFGGETTPPDITESKDIIKYSDGTELSYNTESSELTIKAVGELKIKFDKSITVESPEVTVKSDKIDLGSDAMNKLVTDKHKCFFSGGLHAMPDGVTMNVVAK